VARTPSVFTAGFPSAIEHVSLNDSSLDMITLVVTENNIARRGRQY
jgi:hypothetical protein